MHRLSLQIILFTSLLLLAGTAGTHAQVQKGTVSGYVLGPGNAPVTGLVVKLVGAGRRVVTDDEGNFLFGSVPPGIYTLEVFRDDEAYCSPISDLYVSGESTTALSIQVTRDGRQFVRSGMGRSLQSMGTVHVARIGN